MKTQSSNQSVGGHRTRGRIFVFETFDTRADFEGERFGERDGDGRLEVLARAVGLGGEVGMGGERGDGARVPLIVIALGLETVANAIAEESLVFVARAEAGVAFVEPVAVADQAQGEGMLAGGETGRAAAAPALLGIVNKLIEVKIGGDLGDLDFKFNADLLRVLAADDAVGNLAGAQLLLQIGGERIEAGGVELLADEGDQLMAQAEADLVGGFGAEVGGPALTGKDHGFDGVAGVDIDIGILRCGEEEAAKQKGAEPGESHAAWEARWAPIVNYCNQVGCFGGRCAGSSQVCSPKRKAGPHPGEG